MTSPALFDLALLSRHGFGAAELRTPVNVFVPRSGAWHLSGQCDAVRGRRHETRSVALADVRNACARCCEQNAAVAGWLRVQETLRWWEESAGDVDRFASVSQLSFLLPTPWAGSDAQTQETMRSLRASFTAARDEYLASGAFVDDASTVLAQLLGTVKAPVATPTLVTWPARYAAAPARKRLAALGVNPDILSVWLAGCAHEQVGGRSGPTVYELTGPMAPLLRALLPGRGAVTFEPAVPGDTVETTQVAMRLLRDGQTHPVPTTPAQALDTARAILAASTS